MTQLFQVPSATTHGDQQMNVVASVVKIDPDMARNLLGLNSVNRNIKPGKVQQYVRDMLAGRWQVTGEAIKLSSSGRLLDGQNRLTALIQAGVVLEMLVVTGLADETQIVMDSGAVRSASDALHMTGMIKNTSTTASCLRWLLATTDNGTFDNLRRRVYTNAEVVATLPDYPTLPEACAKASAVKAHVRPLSPTAVAYCWIKMHDIDPYQTELFWNDLVNLVGLEQGDPVLALARRLRSGIEGREKWEPADMVSAVFRTWNARRTHRPMAKIPMSSSVPELL